MIIIAFLAPTFLAGAFAGALALVVPTIRREDHSGCLPDEPPTRTAAAVRKLVGLRVRGTQRAISALRADETSRRR